MPQPILDAYNALKALITERQANEAALDTVCKYPTTIDFADIEGHTLLQYAAMLGDIDKITECLDKDAEVDGATYHKSSTALYYALKNNHLDAAKYLVERGAKWSVNYMHLSDLQSIKAWSHKQTTSLIDSRLEAANKLTIMTMERIDYDLNILNIAAFAGNLNVVKQIHDENHDFISPPSQGYMNNLICLDYACTSGAIDVIEYILSHNPDPNPSSQYSKTCPLHSAVRNNHTQATERLLQAKADIHQQDLHQRNTLMMANTAEMATQCLQAGARLDHIDAYGNTIFHLVIERKQYDIMTTLLEHPNSKAVLQTKNIYGFTALEAALMNRDTKMIKLLAPSMQLTDIKKHPYFVNPPVDVSQNVINRILHYYLRLNYRSTHFFSVDGNCNGYIFLFLLYRKAKFYDRLRLFAKWDGSLEALQSPLPDSKDHSTYSSLSELFDEWIEKITWFQCDADTTVASLAQHERQSQYDLLKTDDDTALISHYKNQRDQPMTAEQLKEILRILCGNVSDQSLEICSKNHIAGMRIMRDSMCDYYDSNFQYPLAKLLTLDEMIAHTIKTLFISLGRYSIDHLFAVDLQTYSYAKQSCEVLNNAALSTSLPESLDEDNERQKQSASQFTSLHVACIAKRITDLKHLLSNGVSNPNATNIWEQTALDIAVLNRWHEGIAHFLQTPNLDLTTALATAYLHKHSDILDLLLKNANKSHTQPLLFYAIFKGDIDLVDRLINNNLIEMNLPRADGYLPINFALDHNQLSIVEHLFDAGAHCHLPSKTRVTANHVCVIEHLFELNKTECDYEHKIRLFRRLLSKDAVVQAFLQSGPNLFSLIPSRYIKDTYPYIIARGFLPQAIINNGTSFFHKQLSTLKDLSQKQLPLTYSGLNPIRHMMPGLTFDLTSDSDCQFAKLAFKFALAAKDTALCQALLEKVDLTHIEGGNVLLHRTLYQAVITNDISIFRIITENTSTSILKFHHEKHCATIPQVATVKGRLDILKLCIEKGVDCDTKNDKSGNTLLNLAVRKLHLPIIEYLLEIGADPTLTNNKGESAIDLAQSNDNEEIKQVFRGHFASSDSPGSPAR